MLKVEKINFAYGPIQVLFDADLEVKRGECVALLGSNGAGKTTLLKNLSGILKASSGTIIFENINIEKQKASARLKAGLVQVPEGGKIFPYMTVWDNLLMGASGQKKAWKLRYSTAERVEKLFPILKERRDQRASLLSGGERQMLVIARGMMALPKLLLVDEPSLGLSPKMLLEIFNTLKVLHEEGVTILISEQNIQHALRLANRGYVLENGRVVMADTSEQLLNSDYIRQAYLGL
ncbi:MAG TPA: ABC transporter ATP-binding protein [Smithellaceae bacterium]|nr:ABC transporter ATP-binding protein [Smithellaceae bacterium]